MGIYYTKNEVFLSGFLIVLIHRKPEADTGGVL